MAHIVYKHTRLQRMSHGGGGMTTSQLHRQDQTGYTMYDATTRQSYIDLFVTHIAVPYSRRLQCL